MSKERWATNIIAELYQRGPGMITKSTSMRDYVYITVYYTLQACT